MINAEYAPILAWAYFLIPLALYESFGLWKGYKWTLTAGMRLLMTKWKPLRYILAVFIAWLFWHFIIEGF